jgi:hypothetical protein
MNLGDVKTRVKRQFGDESAVQIDDNDITRWVNDGIEYIVMHNEGLLEKVSTINRTANVQDYSLPSDLLMLKSVHTKINPESLSYTHMLGYDLQKFDSYIDGWDGTYFGTGPSYIYTIYADLLRVFPIPESDITDGFKFFYNRKPNTLDVGDDNVVLDLPITYHNGVVDYCLQQAYELDENFDGANAKQAQLQNVINMNRYNDGWPNKEFYPTITAIPDDAW